MNLSKRNLIIIGSIFGVLIIGLSVAGFLLQSRQNSETPDAAGYTDPSSGEVIRSDKSPQRTDDALKNAIIYPGFSKLLDRGLSTTEIISIQNTILEYSLSQTDKFKEVSLVTDSMRYAPSPEDAEKSMLTFSLKVNRKNDYYVTVTPKDSVSSTTRLYAADKTTLLIER